MKSNDASFCFVITRVAPSTSEPPAVDPLLIPTSVLGTGVFVGVGVFVLVGVGELGVSSTVTTFVPLFVVTVASVLFVVTSPSVTVNTILLVIFW